MAERTLSIDELLALQKSGADIKTESRPTILATIKQPDPKPTEIVKFEELIEKLGEIGKYDELVKKLSEMSQATSAMVKSNERVARSNEIMAKSYEQLAKSNEALAGAEAAKAKTQLEVLATLQSLIKSGSNVPKVQPVDLTPLKSVLSEIKNNTTPYVRSGYEFKIERHKQTGFCDKIIATPTTKINH